MAAALLVAAQPHLTAADYESAATLYAALNASLRRLERSASARQSGHTLVVFPELVGTWLAVSGHHAAASSSTSAMVGMLLEQPLAFAFELLRSVVRDWWHRSLLGHMQRAAFALAAPRVWRSWRLVFATLALQHGCWIVAGSAYLPRLEFAQCTHEQRQRRVDHPHDRATLAVPDAESQPRVTRDGLYNVSVLFGPDGRAHSASYKVHLIPDEREFADAAPLEWLRPTRCAPFGLVGTIICADSWHDTPYTQLQRCADAEQEPMAVLAVPTYLTPAQNWEAPWPGYNCDHTTQPPSDVDQADVQHISEADAWLKYAMPSRLARLVSNVRCVGVNSFFQGGLWDLQAGGLGVITHGHTIVHRSNQEHLVLEWPVQQQQEGDIDGGESS